MAALRRFIMRQKSSSKANANPCAASQETAVLLRVLLCASALCSAACGRPHTATAKASTLPASNLPTSTAPTSTPPTSTLPTSSCLPSHDGYLRLRMRGDTNADIDWRDQDMHCDGGPRPGQQGLRLTFAGPTPGAGPASAAGTARNSASGGTHTLRFVFGIATAAGARQQRNVPANVTVIFEGQRKLFSTAGDGRCTIDELSEQPLPAPADPKLRRLSARGFCTAPATALAGSAQLLLSRFDFAGPVTDEDAADAPPAVTP
jgi:hypothetical protein